MNNKNKLGYEYGGRRPDGLITVYGIFNYSPVVEFAGRADYRAGIVKIWPVKKLRSGNYDAKMTTIAMRDIKAMK